MIQNICHLIASREHGGLEKHVADLSRWQVHNTDAQVSVIAHPRYLTTLDENVRFMPLNTDRSRHHPNLVWRLANQIRNGQFQITHGHGSKSAQLLAAVQKYTDSRQVITRHNMRHPRDKLASAFDARIAVSQCAVANSRLNWNIIPNGMDPNWNLQPQAQQQIATAGSAYAITDQKKKLFEQDANDDHFTMLTSSRLLKSAGIEELLQAMTLHDPTRLIVHGDGPEHTALQQLINRLNLQKRVQLTGHNGNLHSYLHNVDILVIPARSEATPYTFIEALLNRCPIIASRASNAADYLQEEYLFDNLQPEHIAAKIRHALQDRTRLQQDFSGIFDIASTELTLENMGRATWKVYTQLIA